MSKNLIALNQNNNGLSNSADFKESHLDKSIIAENYRFAVRIKKEQYNAYHLKSIDNKAFIYAMRNNFVPEEARKIISKLNCLQHFIAKELSNFNRYGSCKDGYGFGSVVVTSQNYDELDEIENLLTDLLKELREYF